MAGTMRGIGAGLVALVLLVVFQTVSLGTDGDDVSWYGMSSLTTKSKPGQDFGLGGYLRNDGDRPITLRSITLDDDVPPEQGLLRTVLVHDLESAGFGVGAVRWPHQELARYVRPLADYVIEPGEEVGLVMVIEVRGSGPMEWTRGTLTYERDGEVRKVPGSMHVALCPTRSDCTAERDL